jgi:lipopolysaccharide export system protein LptC
MWSPRQTLLAVALAGLGGIAWWIMRGRGVVETPAVPRQRTPDYIVARFTAVETDDSGRPQRRLVAEQLRQFVSEDLAELDAPRLSLFEAEGPPWEAESRSGLLLRGGEEVQLTDSVTVQRAGFGANRAVRFSPSELFVWPKRQYAEGDRPVRIDSERDWLTSSGARIWYAEPGRADFSGRVHIYLAPADVAGDHAQESSP